MLSAASWYPCSCGQSQQQSQCCCSSPERQGQESTAPKPKGAARAAEELLAEEEAEDRRRRRVDNASKAPRYLVVVDFECTCEDQEEPFVHEIIEFPAVLLDMITRREVRHFHAFVKPTERPVLIRLLYALDGD